jgi:DNA-binding response OmpR family regulator
MEKKSILIVDDEKNIRWTMAQALEPLELEVETAVNGEEALQKLMDHPFSIIFLDLRMPGMSGIEALRHIKEKWPEVRVIIITAHGTVETAVEAMKLGAADFIQKPFSPAEIRTVVSQVLARESLDEQKATDYLSIIELTKRHIGSRRFEEARQCLKKAIAADPTQPEVYNLMGALFEIKADAVEAQRFYRAALEIDPTYKPAGANLERITSWNKFGGIDLGAESPQASPPIPKTNGAPDGK